MNTQRYSSLSYNVTLYQVFFGRKYYDYTNSLTIVEKTSLDPVRFIDEWINNAVDKNLPIIDKVMEE